MESQMLVCCASYAGERRELWSREVRVCVDCSKAWSWIKPMVDEMRFDKIGATRIRSGEIQLVEIGLGGALFYCCDIQA